MTVLDARTLEARQYCRNRWGQTVRCRNNTWNSWARWLVLGLVIAAVIVLFLSFACISARRRKRMGNQPFRGTGWAVGRTPPGHAQPTYNNNAQPYYANNNDNNNNNNNSDNPAPPPAYQPPANNSYYGVNPVPHNGTELQQPEQAYRSGESQYEPPKGPPPGR